MTASKLFLATIPATTMIVVVVFMPGIEHWLAAFGKTAQAKLMLGRIGLALPYATAAAIGTIFLFAANGVAGIKAAGWGVVSGNGVAILIALLREGVRLAGIAGDIPKSQSVLGYADPTTMLGASTTFLAGVFALRVAMKGTGSYTRPERMGFRASKKQPAGRIGDVTSTISGHRTSPRSRERLLIVSELFTTLSEASTTSLLRSDLPRVRCRASLRSMHSATGLRLNLRAFREKEIWRQLSATV